MKDDIKEVRDTCLDHVQLLRNLSPNLQNKDRKEILEKLEEFIAKLKEELQDSDETTAKKVSIELSKSVEVDKE